MRLQGTLAVCTAALLGAVSWSVPERFGPPPAADVSRGSEEAFVRDLYPRELLPGQVILRWTRPHALVRFERVTPGPAELEVRVVGQRPEVAVSANGVVVARLLRGQRGGRFPVQVRQGGEVLVELSGEGFVQGGRELGVQLQRVALHCAEPRGLTLSWLPAVAAATLAAGALAAGAGPWPALAWGAGGTAVGVAALWPHGLLHSGYAAVWVGLQVAGSLVAGGLGAWWRRRRPGSGAWAWAACTVAWWVLVGAGTSPLLVMSDAVFHANQLRLIAAGELFPVSVSQHAEPFRIPYGPLFYLLLAPLYRAGLDPVALVQWGAALSCLAGCCWLFGGLAGKGAAQAGLAVLLLQLVPGWFDVLSHGNLSNAFAQAMTLGFAAWGITGGHPAVGALTLLGASLGHLSAAIVVAGVAVGLVLWSPPERRGPLLRGIVPGLALSLLYYLGFWSLVTDQLPRLLEGGGQGRGASQGAGGALQLQLSGVLQGWGWPAVALALFKLRRGALRDPLWRAFWAWGAILALTAVFSPLEVRYRYALTLPLAVAAAGGLRRLWETGRAGKLAGLGLCAAQVHLAVANLADALLWRYRP
jgi:hypothetical protein